MRGRTFDKNRCRMAAFDLDGTLLREFSLLPAPAVKKALQDLQASGVAVVLSSGRDLSQVALELRECFRYAVLTNGSCVAEIPSGRLLYSHPIPWRTLYRAMKTVKKYGGACFLMQFGIIRGTKEGKKIVAETMLKHLKKEDSLESYSKEMGEYSSDLLAANPFARPTYKVQVFFRSREDCDRAYEDIRQDKDLEVLQMFGSTIEITAADVTKAAALNALCEQLGMEPGSYAAFGDGSNDLAMLRSSAFAVAMENGEQCVKDIADYIAPSVNEDGAAKAIYDLFL